MSKLKCQPEPVIESNKTDSSKRFDVDKPLTQLLNHIDAQGFTRASLAYRWYEAAWFRDSSMIVLGLCDVAQFLKESGDPKHDEAVSAAGRTLGFLWSSMGKFNGNIRKAIELDPRSDQFNRLENHIPARMGEDGKYFSCMQDGVEYSDTQEDNKYIKLRQYDSAPLAIIATEIFIEDYGAGALSAKSRNAISANLNDLVAYMLKVYRTAGANAWELDDDQVHAYTVASISRGLRGAMFLAKSLNVDISQFGDLNRKVRDIDRFIEKTFVRDGVLYRSAKSVGGTRVASEPELKVDASEIFIFTVFKPRIDPEVEANTIARIERDLFNGNVLPIRFLNDPYFSGGRWPLLGLEFARYYAEQGKIDSAFRIIDYVTTKHLDTNIDGALPEQELVDVACPNEDLDNWLQKNGNKVIGELGWSEAEYLVAAVSYMRAADQAARQTLMSAIRTDGSAEES